MEDNYLICIKKYYPVCIFKLAECLIDLWKNNEIIFNGSSDSDGRINSKLMEKDVIAMISNAFQGKLLNQKIDAGTI